MVHLKCLRIGDGCCVTLLICAPSPKAILSAGRRVCQNAICR
ncbi:hypothetical protein AIOL_004334 [Candidatus Rhodobacter oscarellae]|uniref:Uncharacterized protein n=1 Tax=Candidatus Rhodobacter oscarellae TaxID=1675527 RepID=A0A0J9E982_9RHOB|nr:hypothetical protein AIOL_004334 [Candidatus Rhodobacter lobularis]